MRLLVLLSFIFSGLGFAGTAHAQEMPPFAMPQIITEQDVDNLAVDFDDAFNTIQNPFLSDTIKLHYQISVLDKLVERQSALLKIQESYGSLGIAFTPPPPPRGICAQLPANGPCLAAYPELYGELVAERRAYYKRLEIQAKDAEPGRNPGESDEAMLERQRKEAEERARKAEQEARKTRYKWAEVTCLLGKCRALLVHSSDPAIRYTVYKGTRLPDGTVVENVEPSDVRVSMDGEMIKLRPSPGEESANAAAAAINPLADALTSGTVGGSELPSASESRAAAADIIANATGNASPPADGAPAAPGATPPNAPAAATPPPVNGAAAGSAPPQPVDDAPLGPSGLF